MKHKIALASAFVAASSLATAEIVINDFLSFEGFVDMSYSHTDQEVGAGGLFDGSSNSFGLDQVEIDWLFNFNPVTAQIDLAHEGSDSPRVLFIDASFVEQAFVTYSFDNGSAVTAGRFASMLGFEAFEPTGLYQYSFAYKAAEDVDSPFSPTVAIDGGILPLYDQGVKYTYETETSFFGISIVDATDVDRLGGSGGSDFGIEAAGSLQLGNGLTWFAGGRYNEGDQRFPVAYDNEYILDTYLTFETGAWLFAAELAYAETSFDVDADREILQGLLMANFAYSENASITGRLSFVDGEQGPLEEDFVKYTLAHGYAFTDNLSLVNEISYVDGETNVLANNDVEILTAAVELIFSF